MTKTVHNWRHEKEDASLSVHAFELWRTRKVDTRDIASILKIPESRVYNMLSRRAAPPVRVSYAGAP